MPEALSLLEAAGTDSDADGVGDVDELRVGDDPNAPDRSLCALAPRYGCGAQVAPRSASGPATWGALALLLGLGVAWRSLGLRRARRRRGARA